LRDDPWAVQKAAKRAALKAVQRADSTVSRLAAAMGDSMAALWDGPKAGCLDFLWVEHSVVCLAATKAVMKGVLWAVLMASHLAVAKARYSVVSRVCQKAVRWANMMVVRSVAQTALKMAAWMGILKAGLKDTRSAAMKALN
jgi:hypothetical protein